MYFLSSTSNAFIIFIFTIYTQNELVSAKLLFTLRILVLEFNALVFT